MLSVEVRAAKPYKVNITHGFSGLKDIAALTGAKKIAVVTDSNVDKLYYGAVCEELDGIEKVKFVIPAGEESKNGENFLKLVNGFAESGLQRGDAVIALGGGVIGDLAGFAAATYMRGIKYIGVPTTLLADVDSSVGGKTAIDLSAGKNMCGAFWQPFAVHINTDCLSTLPAREVLCGMGEVIKYGLLDGRVSLSEIRAGVSSSLIAHCLAVKKDVVEEDEFESGKRMLLNLGHTVGHAVEKLSGYKLSHGECVAKGLNAAISVSAALYGLPESTVTNMREYLSGFGFDLSLGFSAESIVKLVAADKKGAGEYVNFVTLKKAGEPHIEKLALSKLKEILAASFGGGYAG